MTLASHLWTIAPRLAAMARPPLPPPGRRWRGSLHDRRLGEVELSGALSVPPGARHLLLLVHGLGGSAESPYLVKAARAAHEVGLASLRLNLRGSDRRGDDYYHAGLTEDLAAALASPDLAPFAAIALVGFSLGGHLALRYLTGQVEERVVAAAAVCAPLDLARGADEIDRPGRWLYRRYLLNHLFEIYERVAARREVPAPLARVRRARGLREFDGLVIAPRFGFADADDYYRRASVGPHLARLARPALLVLARHDPMVPAASVDSWLAARPPALTVRWSERGGHVGFPADLDLGLGGPPGLLAQLLAWLRPRLQRVNATS